MNTIMSEHNGAGNLKITALRQGLRGYTPLRRNIAGHLAHARAGKPDRQGNLRTSKPHDLAAHAPRP